MAKSVTESLPSGLSPLLFCGSVSHGSGLSEGRHSIE